MNDVIKILYINFLTRGNKRERYNKINELYYKLLSDIFSTNIANEFHTKYRTSGKPIEPV